MVVFAGDSKDDADAKAQQLISELSGTGHEPTVKFYDDPAREQELRRCPGGGAGRHGPGGGHARYVGRLGGLRGAARAPGRLPA